MVVDTEAAVVADTQVAVEVGILGEELAADPSADAEAAVATESAAATVDTIVAAVDTMVAAAAITGDAASTEVADSTAASATVATTT